MSEPVLKINVAAWVRRAEADPVTYQQRQTIEITLNAIAMTAPLHENMFLKGGVLMVLAYDSPRQTADIDLTTTLEPEGDVGGRVKGLLDSMFPRSAASLGYADLIFKTDSVEQLPKRRDLPDATCRP